jgi:hypothetical protein
MFDGAAALDGLLDKPARQRGRRQLFALMACRSASMAVRMAVPMAAFFRVERHLFVSDARHCGRTKNPASTPAIMIIVRRKAMMDPGLNFRRSAHAPTPAAPARRRPPRRPPAHSDPTATACVWWMMPAISNPELAEESPSTAWVSSMLIS